MISLIRQHKTATIIYIIYILLWIWLSFIAYNDFNNFGHGETIGMNLFFFSLLFFGPYFFGVLWFIFTSKDRGFYLKLILFMLVPVVIFIITAYVFNIFGKH